MPQIGIPAVFMRGGTSKGVFVDLDDLPAPGPARDEFILELLGSPDAMQIDGMGGTFSSTSKVMAVTPSDEPGIDVDYLFAQGAIDRPLVDYKGNCGNLTSAIGVYAIDEGLVQAQEPVTTVMLRNLNTGVRVRAHIPVVEGRAAVQGDHAIAGVPRPGARIDNEYLEPGGAVFGKLLPTGEPRETLETPDGPVEVSIVDVANPVVFVKATDVGLRGDELPPDVNSDPTILARLEALRGAAAVRLGLVEHAQDAADKSSSLPMLSIVSAPEAYETATGVRITADDMDLRARAATVQKMHHAYPMTVLMCTASAARLPGTVVHDLVDPAADGPVRIGHPKGVAEAAVDVDDTGPRPGIAAVRITRTARRLMAGEVYVRATPERLAARTEGAH